MTGPTLPENEDLKSILEHVRGQFQYHATQRLNTIRYFFVAYAIFVTAYVTTISGKASDAPAYIPFVLSFVSLIIVLGFWGLDARNEQMVHVDEHALAEIERLVAAKHHYEHFETAKKRDETAWPHLLRYKVIVKILFLTITVISLLATIRDFMIAFYHH